MFNLFKKKPPITTLRLYALQKQGDDYIQRPQLLKGVFAAWKSVTGTLPEDFDIDGPYGIAKGRTVGLKSFLSKLQKKGHSAYHGYTGVHEDHGGLHVSFFEAPPYSAAFVEIVLWLYEPNAVDAAVEMVRQLLAMHKIDYGYLIELPHDHDPVSEPRIKRGILGTSISVGNNSLNKWHRQVQTLQDGLVRDIYSLNFLNAKQVEQITHL
ncbi:hypothetical protein SAMN05518865_12115 [Duganella sp. CF458]|uniref:hypothetical protein n=1 Tax=Duganella sp. CF458 TaxID=1884368 RepID=UPI0008F29994|nr:hypothetical protein [Duganella sp. CF458]SFG87402.1 hypothetical protein SAMN05518865_12115 [Duganella sp. CF458]